MVKKTKNKKKTKSFRPQLKEDLILASLAKGDISESTAIDLLTEANLPSFSQGEKVYVAHGIGAGWYGKYVGESGNTLYARVKAGTAGDIRVIPKIFLQKSQNR